MPRHIDTLPYWPSHPISTRFSSTILLSTEKLTNLAGIRGPQRTKVLQSHGPDAVRLPSGLVIRDQRRYRIGKPADEGTGVALDDGLNPEDWYALLNRFVFLWPQAT